MKHLIMLLLIVGLLWFASIGGLLLSIPDGNGSVIVTTIIPDQTTRIDNAQALGCDLRTAAVQSISGDSSRVAAYCAPGETPPAWGPAWLDKPIVVIPVHPVVIGVPIPTAITIEVRK